MKREPETGDSLESRVLGDSGLQSQTLEDISSAVRYHSWLTDLALPYLGDNPLELGSGLGDYAQTWLDHGVPRMTVTDLDPTRLGMLRQRFTGDPRVTVRLLDVVTEVSPSRGADAHSSMVAFNVLEHIPQDVEALRAAHRLVRPGGAVVMFVPAFPFAMSEFDREIGHVRRYTKSSLSQAFAAAGLELEEMRYVNIPGLAAWTVGMKWFRMTPGDGPLLRVWDGVVVPTTRAIEKRLRAPFGQSVFAVARVP